MFEQYSAYLSRVDFKRNSVVKDLLSSRALSLNVIYLCFCVYVCLNFCVSTSIRTYTSYVICTWKITVRVQYPRLPYTVLTLIFSFTLTRSYAKGNTCMRKQEPRQQSRSKSYNRDLIHCGYPYAAVIEMVFLKSVFVKIHPGDCEAQPVWDASA